MFYEISLILSATPPLRTLKAEVVDWGSNKDQYNVGDKATAWISIKNTGDSEINSVEVRGGIEKDFLGKFIKLISDRLTVPIYRIRPGDTERYQYSGQIPNFPGRYRVKVKVLVEGEEIADVQKDITIVR